MSVIHVDPIAPRRGAMSLEVVDLVKRFGAFTALDQVGMHVAPGSVHAILGENGAGKSTLVKCLAGIHRADSGSFVCDGRERSILHPAHARELGIGMVHQHFTLARGMTVAENLLLAGGRLPGIIRWREERRRLSEFLDNTPFRLDLEARPGDLSAGEMQKLELLKQLLLGPRLLILDEPTSVLTPQEADEVLGHVRALARAGQCTVLLITHKFREVQAFADEVTVLRRGHRVLSGAVSDTDATRLAQAMVDLDEGDGGGGRASGATARSEARPSPVNGSWAVAGHSGPALRIRGLRAMGDRGTLAVRGIDLEVQAGEIVGLAGVSGNGQRELMEAVVGQRARVSGVVEVGGEPYQGTRAQNRRLGVRSLPEEPLRNACVGHMSVAQNMALRDFDVAPLSASGWLRRGAWRARALRWISDFGVRTRGPDAPVASLSGGNVQRAVLARELQGPLQVLIAVNPIFGLDFAAVADIHARLRWARAQGAAVLLISEDLDELLELSDRIAVISEGRLVAQMTAQSADRRQLGLYMGGSLQENAS